MTNLVIKCLATDAYGHCSENIIAKTHRRLYQPGYERVYAYGPPAEETILLSLENTRAINIAPIVVKSHPKMLIPPNAAIAAGGLYLIGLLSSFLANA